MGATAAVIAAKQRRTQEIIDAFRLGDATSPERAKSLDTLALPHSLDVQELIVEGILMPGAREGTYYLSEIGYIYRRDERRGLRGFIVVVVMLLLVGLLLIPIMASRG